MSTLDFDIEDGNELLVLDLQGHVRLRVSFLRTLRVPDDGRCYPMPAGMGPLPLRRVSDCADRVPRHWLDTPGILLPMHAREAVWLAFAGDPARPCAVKVGTGMINAVSGHPWQRRLTRLARPSWLRRFLGERPVQDYLVCPPQRWLDGFNTGHATIRQFVAAPLGQGLTVEGQLTGQERHGGIQLLVYEPRPGRFPAPQSPPRQRSARAGEPTSALTPDALVTLSDPNLHPTGTSMGGAPLATEDWPSPDSRDMAGHADLAGRTLQGIPPAAGTSSGPFGAHQEPAGMLPTAPYQLPAYGPPPGPAAAPAPVAAAPMAPLAPPPQQPMPAAPRSGAPGAMPRPGAPAGPGAPPGMPGAPGGLGAPPAMPAGTALPSLAPGAAPPFLPPPGAVPMPMSAPPMPMPAPSMPGAAAPASGPPMSYAASVAMRPSVAAPVVQQSLGVAAGGQVSQKIYPDPYGIDTWDEAVWGELCVYIVPAELWQRVTGEEPPPLAANPRDYAALGYPWFDIDDSHMGDVAPADPLRRIKSIDELQKRGR